MEWYSIITASVLCLAPVLGFLFSTTKFFNISKKDLSECFEKIQRYIHKRKIDNLLKIIDPESAGILKIGGDIQVNTDTLISLSKDIDNIQALEKCLYVTKSYSNNFYLSLFGIFILGLVYLVLSWLKIRIDFLEKNYILTSLLIVSYVIIGLVFLIKKREKLDKIYSSEYDI